MIPDTDIQIDFPESASGAAVLPVHSEANPDATENTPPVVLVEPKVIFHKTQSNVPDLNDNDTKVVIITGDLPTVQSGVTRRVSARDLRLLIIFSVVAIILFFPTGIFAMYFALQTKRLYNGEGVDTSVSDYAYTVLKACRRAERFIVLSFVAGLFGIVLVFAILENKNAHKDGYWHHGNVGIGRTST